MADIVNCLPNIHFHFFDLWYLSNIYQPFLLTNKNFICSEQLFPNKRYLFLLVWPKICQLKFPENNLLSDSGATPSYFLPSFLFLPGIHCEVWRCNTREDHEDVKMAQRKLWGTLNPWWHYWTAIPVLNYLPPYSLLLRKINPYISQVVNVFLSFPAECILNLHKYFVNNKGLR